LHQAYLLKEGLRHVFSVKAEQGKQALDRRISWARRCRIPVFVELAGRIVQHRDATRGIGRIHQHQDPTPDPDCVRIPHP